MDAGRAKKVLIHITASIRPIKMQHKTFFRFRLGILSLLLLAITACGGGGSAEDAGTQTQQKLIAPNMEVSVKSAVFNNNVKIADELLVRDSTSPTEFIDLKNSGFILGDIFSFQKSSYKITGVTKNPDNSNRIYAEAASLKEIYSDLKINIKTNALAYDEQGKPLTFNQLGIVKRSSMQLGLINPLGNMKKCISVTNDADSKSASAGNVNNFGYEFAVTCSLGELLEIDRLNAVKIEGTFKYTATTEYIIDLKDNSNYSIFDSDVNGKLEIKLEGASFAKISELTKTSDNCKTKTGSVECELNIYKSPEKSILIGGVPITFQAGVRIKITVNADGTAILKFQTGSVNTAGLVSGIEKNERVDKPNSGTSFDPLSFSGELEAYIYGYASASALGTPTIAVVNGEVNFGAFGAISAEPPAEASKGCIKLSVGMRAGVELEILKFGNKSLFELNGVHSTVFAESTLPKNCDTTGRIKLRYLIRGKNYYTENIALSTDSIDFYDVSYNLFQLHSDELGNYFTIDTAPSTALIGKPLAFEIIVKDFSKNPNIKIIKASSGLRENLIAKIYPGQNTYGDVIKLEVRAYVPDDRAATELVREIRLKIELPLEAKPTYWKEIDTEGKSHWILDHGFLGDTRARLKNAINIFTADGKVDISSHRYTEVNDSVLVNVSYFDTTSTSELSRGEISNTPISLGLSSAALKAGSEQSFKYSENTRPSIYTVTYEPTSPQVDDIITFIVKGDRLPPDINIKIPNCKYIDEQRSKKNLQNNTFSTVERIFYCKNNAAGVDLVAEFGFLPYPVVFSVVEKSTGDFVSSPKNPKVGDTVAFHLFNIWKRAESVMWSIYGYTLDLVTQVKEGAAFASQAYEASGVKTIAVDYRDSNGVTLRNREYTITVGADFQLATITGVVSHTATGPGSISNNGTTDDTRPTLHGTLSAPLISGQNINVYDGTVRLSAAALVAPGSTTWTFTPATGLIGGLHIFTADVSDFQAVAGARSAAYVVNVLSASVATVSPDAITRTLTGSFEIVGRGLPTSGISVTVPGDPRAVCQAPTTLTANGFKVACLFYKLGPQPLEIRTASMLLGTVTVNVKTNVTSVNWTSPSTTASGTVKFGETVTFKVAGVNMLADPSMGFAVQLCGVSNTEIGTRSDTLRTFSCDFNNTAGAVTGQMPGVVKDSQGGQVLLDGWQVAVEVPVALTNSGSFSVPANLAQGVPFTIPNGMSSCTFNALGVWASGSNLANLSADGYGPGSAVSGMPMYPGSAASLIALQNGQYINIGTSKLLQVRSGEILTFALNDYVNSYSDNSGAISVAWTCTAAEGTIFIPAANFVRGLNVALSANGQGVDAVMNAPPYGSAPNAAEWDINVPSSGRYELFAEYASALNRPVTISFNGIIAFANALASVTGGWFPSDRQVLSQGIVQLSAGENTMRVSRTDVFPHIKGFTLVPM